MRLIMRVEKIGCNVSFYQNRLPYKGLQVVNISPIWLANPTFNIGSTHAHDYPMQRIPSWSTCN